MSTEFSDGLLEQVLDIAPLVRRGRTQAATQGIYGAYMRNVHGGATTLQTNVNPFSIAAAAVVAPWPNPMPRGFDIWLISASLEQVSGSGTVDARLGISGLSQGWGIDDSGNFISGSDFGPIAAWNNLRTMGSVVLGTLVGNDEVRQEINLRLQRNLNLYFSSTASALATYDCQMIFGVFPVGLGQDVKV